MTRFPNGNMQFIPEGFDPAREIPELNRSGNPGRVAELIERLDYVTSDIMVSGDNGMARTMADLWSAYREEMRKL